MPKTIPFVRAHVLIPMINWLRAQGRPVQQRLEAVDLAYFPLDNPLSAVPLFNAAAFFREMGQIEGPDIGCRVINENSLLDLAGMGKVLLGASSPRESLQRTVAVMPYHCLSEHFQIFDEGDQMRLVEGWSVTMDAETLHITQQFVASLVALLSSMAERRVPLLDRVEMVAHPQHGLDHLTPWFGRPVHPARDKTLKIHLASAVADRRYRQVARDRSDRMAGVLPLMDIYDTLADSARPVIAAMLETGLPTVERLALTSGMSLRTLQRRLAEEGTSFSELLEQARRDMALQRIAASDGSLSVVSATVGFARQSALTRAVRRWTGQAPSALRKAGRD
ncbi:MAG: helix-turn-helix transcriptional regulator [Rhodobacteraceae bacterium]|nr:helix-turn-helix transcriptional regulator [Paracoccaceae bacterium]